MRDYQDPQYKKFRKMVRLRDKCCRWPNCGKKVRLQVHHILEWAKYPALRYVIANGITLCKKHHQAIRGKESSYANMFISILGE